MKKLITLLCFSFFALYGWADSGWFQDYIILNVNGGIDDDENNGYYWIGSYSEYGNDFDEQDLGEVSSLILDGCDFRYWDNGNDRDGGSFFYQIRNAEGVEIDGLSAIEKIWEHVETGGNDYQGTLSGLGIDLLNGLDNNTYQLHIWAKSWGTDGDSWLSNGSNNYVATFTVNKSKEVTFNVTVPEGTPGVWITGSFNSWSETFTPMLAGANANEYYHTTTIDDFTVPVGYKYYSAASGWENVENYDSGDPRENEGSEHIADFTSVAAIDDVVPSWNTLLTNVTFNVSFDTGVTIPSNLYIGGNFNFDESWVILEMNANGTNPETFSYTVVAIPRNLEYKYLYDESGSDSSYETTYEGGNRTANSSLIDDTISGWNSNPTSITSPQQSSEIVIGKTATIEVQFEGTATIEIYSTSGVLVEKAIANNQYKKSGLATGLYIVKVNGNVHKIIL